jgi:hypothetical protein
MPDDELLERVRELRARGRSPKEIARALKMPPAAVAPLIRRLAAVAFGSYPGPPVKVPLVLAQRIVFGAIGYARGLGFEPHADFAKAAGYLGDWDGVCDLEFGRDGMHVHRRPP